MEGTTYGTYGTYGTAMGTKMAVAFANIFMADIETQIDSQSVAVKPTVWKRYIDYILTLWDTSNLHDIERFIEQANSYNPTVKFMAEISNAETTFPDKVIYKGNRFHHHSILNIKTYSKPTETFCQYTHFPSSHPPGVKKGFVKGEALRLLRTNSSKTTFEKKIKKFKSRLLVRGYSNNLIKKIIRCQIYRKVIGIEAKRQHPQTNFAFCNNINPRAQPQTCFNGKIALNTKPAFPAYEKSSKSHH